MVGLPSSVVQLAPSTFLASAASSSKLAHHILPVHLHSARLPNFDDAVALWSQGHDQPPPEGVASFHQKSWDSIKVPVSAEAMLDGAQMCRTSPFTGCLC